MARFYQLVIIRDERVEEAIPVIVPSDYVEIDGELNSIVRYMAFPHNPDDEESLKDFIRNQVPPPQDWPSYKCEPKAFASCYREASLLLQSHEIQKKKEVLKEPITTAKHPSTLPLLQKNSKNNYSLDKEAAIDLYLDVPELMNNNRTEISSSVAQSFIHTLGIENNMNHSNVEFRRNINRSMNNESSSAINSTNSLLRTDKFSSEPPNKKYRTATTVSRSNIHLPIYSFIRKVCCQRTKQAPGQVISFVGLLEILRGRDYGLQIFMKGLCCIERSNELVTKTDLTDFQDSLIQYFDKNVKRKLDNLDTKITDLITLTTNRRSLKDMENILTFDGFKEHCNYDFPLHSEADFDSFNTDLFRNTRDLKTNLKKHITSTVNPDTDLVESIRSILRRFIGKDVLLTYTVQKRKGEKKLFKEIAFYSCLRDGLMTTYAQVDKPIEEKLLLQGIGFVFNSVKDWDGGRCNRYKKQT